MKTIEKAIKTLLDSRPFYAHFFLDSRVEYDKYNVTTAGACMTSKGPILTFNTKYIDTLISDELAGVVEHEVLHLLFDHTSLKKDDGYDLTIANIAQDLSINQYIEKLPNGCVTLPLIESKLGLKLEPLQTWEYYYTYLLQKKDQIGDGDEYKFDEHGLQTGEKEGSASDKKVNLRSTLDRAIKASKGNVPKSVLQIYDSLISEHKVPWQQVLSNFVARSIAVSTKDTRKKINRRFGLDQPGKKKKRELVLGVCTDSSGSVSDESFNMFLNEISRISTICQKLYLVDADCTVQNVEVVKKGKFIKRERHGCGGTAYQPAIDECLKRGCDAIIYFGDFDCADTPQDPGKPFLWVGVGNSPKPGAFGAEIRI